MKRYIEENRTEKLSSSTFDICRPNPIYSTSATQNGIVTTHSA